MRPGPAVRDSVIYGVAYWPVAGWAGPASPGVSSAVPAAPRPAPRPLGPPAPARLLRRRRDAVAVPLPRRPVYVSAMPFSDVDVSCYLGLTALRASPFRSLATKPC